MLYITTWVSEMLQDLAWALSLLLLISFLWVKQLKGEIGRLTMRLAESEKETKLIRSRLHKVTGENTEFDACLHAVLSAASDSFTVYSPAALSPPSQAIRDSSPSSSSYWSDFLDPIYLSEFQTKADCALHGEAVTMQVRLKHEYDTTHMLPLSPLLDALYGHSDTVIDLDMRPLQWGGRAVLIHMKPANLSMTVREFLKMFNHEFRTPINIIIGLSELMTADMGISEGEMTEKRHKLLRLSAGILLAMVNSIIHQCEIVWKLPTGLQHTGFDPMSELEEVVDSVRATLESRGNVLDLILETNLPELVWGNLDAYRRFFYFLLSTCSQVTSHDHIFLSIHSNRHSQKCSLTCTLQAHCISPCSISDFHSILELLSCADTDPDSYTAIVKKAEKQMMLNLAIAREMAKLLYGDLTVVDSEELVLKFYLSFSLRKEYVLKRKGKAFGEDMEEYIAIESPVYPCEGIDIEGIETSSDTKHGISRYFSELITRSELHLDTPRVSRRSQTCPTHQSYANQIPSNSGDIAEIVDSPWSNPHTGPLIALVADDVPSNAMVLKEMLSRLGVTVAVVSNGKEAVNYVERNEVDVIFMDYEMPVMGGIEATRRIKGMKKWIPVVAVTANGPEYASQCRAAGMDYFFTKPVRLPVLAALIEQLQQRKELVDKS